MFHQTNFRFSLFYEKYLSYNYIDKANLHCQNKELDQFLRKFNFILKVKRIYMLMSQSEVQEASGRICNRF